MFSKILDYIYPPKCMVCDDIIPLEKERWICCHCKEYINYIEGLTCVSCGIEVEHEGIKCRDCIDRNNLFTKNISIFIYEGVIKDIIYKFKYGKKTYLGKGLGILMSNKLGKSPQFLQNIDYIVPIPIHKNRMRQRGFNQAELLTKEISKNMGIPMLKDLIIRIKDTKPQSKFSYTGRKNNLKNAFKINKEYNINDKSILLVDDIYTTGSTLNSCSQYLLEAGARQVNTTTLSIVTKSK